MKKLIFFLIFYSITSCLLSGNNLIHPSVMFKHLSTTEGLSNNNVRCIYRDLRGFLWIGTVSGLNKYDGYSFQQFYQHNSILPNDEINNIFEDPDHHVWIETSNGYSIYDYITGTFDNNYKAILDKYNIPSKNIIKICSTLNKEFWAYDHNKLYFYNPSNHSVKAYPINVEKISDISIGVQFIYVIYTNGALYSINKQTSEIIEIKIPSKYQSYINDHEPHINVDSSGNLWVYTWQNSLLLQKNRLTHQWEKVDLNHNPNTQYNRVQQILDAGNENIWILTSHKGLYIYNTLNKTLNNLQHDPLKPHTLASNNLNTIYKDQDGIIYIGNFKHGISYYSPLSQNILGYKSLEYDDVLTFCMDANQEFIYYGTDGSGLIRQSLTTEKYEKISTPANIVVDLSADLQGRIWMGSYQKGLVCLNQGKIKQYTTKNSALLEDNVYTVEVDKYGYVWIGTMRGYIQRFNPKTEHFETILYRPGEFFVRDMYYDHNEDIYVATSEGLIMIDIENCSYSTHTETGRFKEQNMNTVYKDSRGLIWIGHSNGLSIWDQQKDSIYYINQQQGLAANLVRAIIEDNNQSMWICTGNGISRIQLKQDSLVSITNYSVSDGLLCNDTNIHAILKQSNGNIFIGTPQGYQTIIPQEVITNQYNRNIYLTQIELKDNTPSTDALHGKSLECAEALTLNERDNTCILSFSTLDFVEMGRIKYEYKVTQLHNDWIRAENNKISLSMLPAGKYTLLVKAYNSQGIWTSQLKKMDIHILPPWWKSQGAYTLYILGFLGLISFILYQIRIHYKQKQILQNIEIENEKQRKINNLKLQFFANISHELRTPLSLIINPLDEFVANHPEYRQGLLEIVKNNADYLLELINQLLDFRKLDAKAEQLNCKHDNILIILNEIFHSFTPIAQKHNINYTFTTDQSSIFMDFDYDKVRKICTNILSNAFKFTPDKGNINMHVEIESSHLIIQFSDTGCGIEDEAKDKIFQRFYQPEKNKSSKGGSGIGLHIVSEYTKMHHGEIIVKDNQPCGSIFQITLPLHQNCLTETMPESQLKITSNEKHPFTILLADDNYDFLNFLSESLGKLYHILKANNGKQALTLLENEDIDLIVSDIMMPEMDGLELCQTIKNDIRYSHIPIILLTAKASEEHQLEGLSSGADDYITKPFNMELLKLRINKIIDMNKKRQEIFNEEMKIEPSHITITPLDKQLVEKAIQIVEDNIGKSEFSVEELSNCLNISRSYFYKKLTKITGKKPIEFIRTIRMKRAQQLLAESQMQVSEIAYTLGYNSPKLFSKHFKEEFNITPSEFLKQQAKDCPEE